MARLAAGCLIRADYGKESWFLLVRFHFEKISYTYRHREDGDFYNSVFHEKE